MTTTTLIDAGRGLTLERAEELVSQIDALAGADAVLDLSKCRYVHPGGGMRLGNALAAAHAQVTVLTDSLNDFSGSWFQNMTRSGLGPAMAIHAAGVRAADQEVLDELRHYYGRGSTESTTFYSTYELDGGGAVAERASFAQNKFRVWLGKVSVRQEHLGTNWRDLVELFYEAICNVVDHAYRGPWPGEAKHSYFSICRYSTMSESGDYGGDFAAYLQLAKQVHPDLKGWLEFIVSDDGVGQAARHSQDPEIYRRHVESEDAALLNSLKNGSTVKLRVEDTVIRGRPGFGYAYVAGSLQELNAYAELRTGRRLLTLDGAAGDKTFKFQPSVYGYLPGTTLRIVMPWDLAQLGLDLAAD